MLFFICLGCHNSFIKLFLDAYNLKRKIVYLELSHQDLKPNRFCTLPMKFQSLLLSIYNSCFKVSLVLKLGDLLVLMLNLCLYFIKQMVFFRLKTREYTIELSSDLKQTFMSLQSNFSFAFLINLIYFLHFRLKLVNTVSESFFNVFHLK